MRYLVTAEYVDPGPLLPLQQLAQLEEQLVIPSFEALAKLEDEKKVLGGGVLAGARGGAFILDVASHDEASQILQDLPFWGVVKWTLTPLQEFRKRAAFERPRVERLKAML
jgi:hypothetical protein